MMRVNEAKEIARQWVATEAVGTPGFRGAFFHGSTNWLADEDELPATSDLDVMVALAGPPPPAKLGKFIYHDLLLEVSFVPFQEISSPEVILGNYHMAGSFRTPGIIADPSGELRKTQEEVAREYAKRHWVIRRCEDARTKVLRHLGGLRGDAPFHEQVTSWLFGTGVTTHVLLVAGLKNPTVRRRYAAVRELLREYGRLDFYEELLELVGCARMSQEQATHHLTAIAEAFDAAKEIIATPFVFAQDLSDSGRQVAIDGSRELIERGEQREAVFWMVATASRCQQVFAYDALMVTQERFRPPYLHLLADLGITSPADLQRRSAQVKDFLPRLWGVAEAIIAANPEIRD